MRGPTPMRWEWRNSLTATRGRYILRLVENDGHVFMRVGVWREGRLEAGDPADKRRWVHLRLRDTGRGVTEKSQVKIAYESLVLAQMAAEEWADRTIRDSA